MAIEQKCDVINLRQFRVYASTSIFSIGDTFTSLFIFFRNRGSQHFDILFHATFVIVLYLLNIDIRLRQKQNIVCCSILFVVLSFFVFTSRVAKHMAQRIILHLYSRYTKLKKTKQQQQHQTAKAEKKYNYNSIWNIFPQQTPI